MTHGLLLKIGLDGGRYDPQPVTRSSERVSVDRVRFCGLPIQSYQSCVASVLQLGNSATAPYPFSTVSIFIQPQSSFDNTPTRIVGVT